MLIGGLHLPVEYAAAFQTKVVPPVPRKPLPLVIKGTPIGIVTTDFLAYKDAEIVYGPTTLTADEIRLYPNGKADETNPQASIDPGAGFANGNVVLTDPTGVLKAHDLAFNWINHTGTAHGIAVDLQGLHVTAGTARISPDGWTLSDVRAVNSERHNIYVIKIRRLVIRPGQRATAYRASLGLFGHTIFTVRHEAIELDERIQGLRYPTLSYTRGEGVGVNWSSSLLINQYTALAGGYSSSPGDLPSYSAQISRSAIDPGQVKGLITPRSELDERFSYGYFDNVALHQPQDQYDIVANPRDTLSFGTFANVFPTDRLGGEVFTKPAELTYERGLPLGGIATNSQFRLQDIRLERGSDHYRALGQTTLTPPAIRLTPNLTARILADGSFYEGGGTSFAWVHSEFGLVFRPNRYIRLGAALVAGKQFGRPLYEADELYSSHGYDLRADFELGPRRLSLITKYDFGRNRWFDHELYFSQVAGALEPFIILRSFPAQVRFGVELRIDSLLQGLKNRSPQRPGDKKVKPID